jgi:predicted dehydrogenase
LTLPSDVASTRRPRIALVGYGYWGPNLARVLQQLHEIDFSAVCDADPHRRQQAGDFYSGVRLFGQFDDLISSPDVDAVVIATPARSHAELAARALDAGKHVLVEKPLALTVSDAETILQKAQSANLTLMVGHTFLYNPAVRYMKRLLDEEALGEVFNLRSTRVNLGRVQRDINAMWSIAPHDVSIFLHLMSETPERVSAVGRSCLGTQVEDFVFLTMTFPDGTVGQVHASWLEPSKVRLLTLVGSRKMVVFDDLSSEGKVRVFDKRVIRVGDGEIFGEWHFKVHTGDVVIPRLDASEPLANELKDFAVCIVTGEEPVSNGTSALEVLRVLEAADQSMRSGGEAVELARAAA